MTVMEWTNFVTIEITLLS